MNSKWRNLPPGVYERLCNCSSIKSDIQPLSCCVYRWNMQKNGHCDPEDAVVEVLELLDCNSCFFDLEVDEYKEIVAAVK